VPLGPDEGLRRSSVANLDNIMTIDRPFLVRPVGSLSAAKMRAVEDAIHFALGLER
jgi:mRNA-degrading endonuclease toxin of MazEF toxin-antitoxin module